MNRTVKTMLLCGLLAVAVLVWVAVQPQFDFMLFMHDFAANLVAWSVVMVLTVYWLERRHKK